MVQGLSDWNESTFLLEHCFSLLSKRYPFFPLPSSRFSRNRIRKRKENASLAGHTCTSEAGRSRSVIEPPPDSPRPTNQPTNQPTNPPRPHPSYYFCFCIFFGYFLAGEKGGNSFHEQESKRFICLCSLLFSLSLSLSLSSFLSMLAHARVPAAFRYNGPLFSSERAQ